MYNYNNCGDAGEAQHERMKEREEGEGGRVEGKRAGGRIDFLL